MKIKVGVIFGGKSVEHEISIISAVTAMFKFDQDKYEVVPIYITKEGEWCTGEMLKDIDNYKDMALIKRYTTNVILDQNNGRFVLRKKHGLFNRVITDIDIAFPITHGTNVEDGALQGYLQTVGVPYVGPNVYSGVVGQDKVYMKRIFEGEDLPLTKFDWFYDSDYKNDSDAVLKKLKKLKFPLIIKPATTGSSVGISVSKDEKELVDSIEEAMLYDSKIIVEEMVTNLKEVNISVLGNSESQEVSEIEEVSSKSKCLTYQDKYIGDGTISHGAKKYGMKVGVKGTKSYKSGMPEASTIPAKLTAKEREDVERIATQAFKVLGSVGLARIDFLIDSKTHKVYINEINSIPGNLSYYLWRAKGIEFTELLNDMINIGVKEFKKRNSKTHSFDTNILAGYTSGGVKGTKKLK